MYRNSLICPVHVYCLTQRSGIKHRRWSHNTSNKIHLHGSVWIPLICSHKLWHFRNSWEKTDFWICCNSVFICHVCLSVFTVMPSGRKGTHLLPCWLPNTLSAPEARLTCPCWGHSSQWNAGHISWAWLSSSHNVWKALAPACWCHCCCCCPAGWNTSAPLAPLVCGWGLAQRTWNRGSTGPQQGGALTNTVKHILRSKSCSSNWASAMPCSK